MSEDAGRGKTKELVKAQQLSDVNRSVYLKNIKQLILSQINSDKYK